MSYGDEDDTQILRGIRMKHEEPVISCKGSNSTSIAKNPFGSIKLDSHPHSLADKRSQHSKGYGEDRGNPKIKEILTELCMVRRFQTELASSQIHPEIYSRRNSFNHPTLTKLTGDSDKIPHDQYRTNSEKRNNKVRSKRHQLLLLSSTFDNIYESSLIENPVRVINRRKLSLDDDQVNLILKLYPDLKCSPSLKLKIPKRLPRHHCAKPLKSVKSLDLYIKKIFSSFEKKVRKIACVHGDNPRTCRFQRNNNIHRNQTMERNDRGKFPSHKRSRITSKCCSICSANPSILRNNLLKGVNHKTSSRGGSGTAQQNSKHLGALNIYGEYQGKDKGKRDMPLKTLESRKYVLEKCANILEKIQQFDLISESSMGKPAKVTKDFTKRLSASTSCSLESNHNTSRSEDFCDWHGDMSMMYSQSQEIVSQPAEFRKSGVACKLSMESGDNFPHRDDIAVEQLEKIHSLLENQTKKSNQSKRDYAMTKAKVWLEENRRQRRKDDRYRGDKEVAEMCGDGVEIGAQGAERQGETCRDQMAPKVLWAITKINIYPDDSRTYEVMKLTDKKPCKLPNSSDSIFVLVPPNDS